MLRYDWNETKNLLLKQTRNISFEDVVDIITHHPQNILADIPHPNQQKYPHQRLFIIKITNYVYVVPYVKNQQVIFLKTIFPSRKLTKQYLHNQGGLHAKQK